MCFNDDAAVEKAIFEKFSFFADATVFQHNHLDFGAETWKLTELIYILKAYQVPPL